MLLIPKVSILSERISCKHCKKLVNILWPSQSTAGTSRPMGMLAMWQCCTGGSARWGRGDAKIKGKLGGARRTVRSPPPPGDNAASLLLSVIRVSLLFVCGSPSSSGWVGLVWRNQPKGLFLPVPIVMLYLRTPQRMFTSFCGACTIFLRHQLDLSTVPFGKLRWMTVTQQTAKVLNISKPSQHHVTCSGS